MITIIYLHGFGSSGNSDKAKLLRSVYPKEEFTIISPDLPVNHTKAINLIKQLLSKKGNYILVGTSLGGFYADYFNKIADIPIAIFNPLVDVKQFESHIGLNPDYANGGEFLYTKKDYTDILKIDNFKNQHQTSAPSFIVVSKDDDVCDYRKAVDYFTEDNQILEVVNQGSHRFTDNNKIIEVIDNLIEAIDDYNFDDIYQESLYENHFIINEHYVNAFTKDSKQTYFNEVKELIEDSYSYIGGYLGNISDLLKDDYFWKLVKRNNKIVAGKIYKNTLGRKGIAAFTDGTPLGKIELKNIIKEDIKLHRAWTEVSGKAENIYKFSMKANPLPHDIVEIILSLMGKQAESWDDDGYHYKRVIKGKLVRKAIYGTAKI